MAKKKKLPDISRHERRRLRMRQILFALVAIIVVASFIISLVSRY
jgi:predicted nucleic acid-binding Zn ribbon protein